MTRAALIIALLPIAACSGQRMARNEAALSQAATVSSQEMYEYPGCANYNADCPRLWTLACGLRAIASKYDTCSKHADCVEAGVDGKCSGAGTCPPYFVNRELKASFEAQAQREIDRYCENPKCSAAGPCGVIGSMEPYCASSHCTWIRVVR